MYEEDSSEVKCWIHEGYLCILLWINCTGQTFTGNGLNVYSVWNQMHE